MNFLFLLTCNAHFFNSLILQFFISSILHFFNFLIFQFFNFSIFFHSSIVPVLLEKLAPIIYSVRASAS